MRNKFKVIDETWSQFEPDFFISSTELFSVFDFVGHFSTDFVVFGFSFCNFSNLFIVFCVFSFFINFEVLFFVSSLVSFSLFSAILLKIHYFCKIFVLENLTKNTRIFLFWFISWLKIFLPKWIFRWWQKVNEFEADSIYSNGVNFNLSTNSCLSWLTETLYHFDWKTETV